MKARSWEVELALKRRYYRPAATTILRPICSTNLKTYVQIQEEDLPSPKE